MDSTLLGYSSAKEEPELITAPSTTREYLTATGATVDVANQTGKVTLGGEEFAFPVCTFTHEQFFKETNLGPIPREVECRIGDRIYPFFAPQAGSAKMAEPPPDVKKDAMPEKEGQEILAPLFLAFLKDVATNVFGGMHFVLHERLPSAFHSPITDRSDVLHVFFECTPTPAIDYSHPKTAFGIKLETPEGYQACLTSFQGRGFTLSEGTHDVVQIVGNNIYILFDPFRLYGLGEQTALTIFRKTIALAVTGWLERGVLGIITSESPAELSEEGIADLAMAFLVDRKKRSLELLIEHRTKVTDLEDRLREEKNSLAHVTRLFRALEDSGYHDHASERLLADHKQIVAHPLVSSATMIPETGFQVSTKTIFICHNGKRYRIGRFVIHFRIEGNPLIWAEESFHPTGEPHPHLSAHNGKCFGNVGETIDDAVIEHRYADAVDYILAWLESYTPDLIIWHKIDEWPLDEPNATNEMEVV